MKRLYWLIIVQILLIPAAAFAEEWGRMRLSFLEGGVQISGADNPDWSDAELNMPLEVGGRIWTPIDSRAEIQVKGGVFIRAHEETAIDVVSIENDAVQLYLERGHAYINNVRNGIRTVQVDSPYASVRIYDNTIVMLDVADEGQTEISVIRGSATAETRTGSTLVGSGSVLTISGDGSAQQAPIALPDDWESWNLDRDRQVLAWGVSGRYLPEELHEYAWDLDRSGRWVFVPNNGYVWTPAVSTGPWAPYSIGRWGWIRGNYVWISSEPWGWAPYHYGRWIFVNNLGWSWVPPMPGAAYWGPGYVGWVVMPDYVCWVPLAPGEFYYGYGDFGPMSVNLITVTTMPPARTYRNAQAPHSVTASHKDDLTTMRRRPMNITQNPFDQRRDHGDFRPPRAIITSRPLQPSGHSEKHEERGESGRATIAPPAPAPSVQRPYQPPDRVTRNRPEEIKSQRKLVQERNASAFKQERPAELKIKTVAEPKVVVRKPAPKKPDQKQQEHEHQ